MDSVNITEALLAKIRRLLETETHFKIDSIFFEIQEDGNFVLVSVPIDEFPESEPPSTFKRVGLLLNEIVPTRIDNDSWMVTFTRAGKVVDSYFGGNLALPNLGL